MSDTGKDKINGEEDLFNWFKKNVEEYLIRDIEKL